ncbi:MAG: hypothetical protein HY757_08545, partial [Nitrospirae bacterium]|nr:hypothetical protein [Nitrospirota bacterium]
MTWVGPDLYASVIIDGLVKVNLDNMTYQIIGLFPTYYALAYDGSTLFASNYGGFYKIDLNTNTATYISNTIADAMAYYDGVLYGAAGTDLFTIDPVSGVKTLIGSGSYDIDALAVSNGVMYGANQIRRYVDGTGDFFTIDMSSGAQILISQSIPHTDALVTLNPPVAINYYCNKDNDGYAASSADGTCTGYGCQPAGCQTAPGGDCNDNNASIHPGAAELCDGLDNNCNGDIDEGIGAYNVETIALNPGEIFGTAPNIMALNRVTKRLYVINENGVLSVIDGSTDTLIKNIILGNGNYSSIDVNTALNNVYITDKANNKLVVVDGYSNTVRARIGVGSSPQKVALNEKTQRVYVSNYGTFQNPGDNTVTVIKALTNTVEATITVGKNPIGIGIYKKMNKVFIANEGSGTASVIEGNPSAPQFNQV